MARVKRPRFLCFFCDDQPFPDVGALLRGEVEPSSLRQIYALSILAGEAVPISADELELVTSTPADRWVEPNGAAPETLTRLVSKGVLLSDGDGDEPSRYRRRDDDLVEAQWNLHGALYYFLTKWHGVDLRQLTGQNPSGELDAPNADVVRAFLDEFGRPPEPFRSADGPVQELPLVTRAGRLYDVLVERRTVRHFDAKKPLGLEELAVVLRYVFGYQAYAPLFGEVMTLKRTSPSSGGLHPVEAYPLVCNVDGLGPGLYHYNPRDHTLEQIAELGRADAEVLAGELLCGQTYFAAAHVTFLLSARFERAFWKYRRHQRGLTAVLMDAAHLTQTLYLVATELGLGAFVTAAINGEDIDARLGLDGVREGAVVACGIGVPSAEPSPFDPRFVPFVPRTTELD